jgi:hypothetical protein
MRDAVLPAGKRQLRGATFGANPGLRASTSEKINAGNAGSSGSMEYGQLAKTSTMGECSIERGS